MIRRISIDEGQARRAIASGEFGADVIRSAANVAVVLTQGWCSEWRMLSRRFDELIGVGEPTDLEIDLHELVYDREPFFREFLEFKERTYGNYAVPYLRYYVDGLLVGESNGVSTSQFLSFFRR